MEESIYSTCVALPSHSEGGVKLLVKIYSIQEQL